MQELELRIIADNHAKEGFEPCWGWSIYIKTGKLSILFDADTYPELFMENLKKLVPELSFNFCVLSHYHADHFGGFEALGKLKPGLRLFVPYYARFLETWGFELEVGEGQIAKNVLLTGKLGEVGEQALGIKTRLGLIVVLGCSHGGAELYIEKLKQLSGEERIFLVIGGLHGPGRSILEYLAKNCTYIAPTHCSGEEAVKYLRENYPEKLVLASAGSIIEISEKGLKIR